MTHYCDGKCDCGSTVGRDTELELRGRTLKVLACVLCDRVRLPSWRAGRVSGKDRKALKRHNIVITRTIERRQRGEQVGA